MAKEVEELGVYFAMLWVLIDHHLLIPVLGVSSLIGDQEGEEPEPEP